MCCALIDCWAKFLCSLSQSIIISVKRLSVLNTRRLPRCCFTMLYLYRPRSVRKSVNAIILRVSIYEITYYIMNVSFLKTQSEPRLAWAPNKVFLHRIWQTAIHTDRISQVGILFNQSINEEWFLVLVIRFNYKQFHLFFYWKWKVFFIFLNTDTICQFYNFEMIQSISFKIFYIY